MPRHELGYSIMEIGDEDDGGVDGSHFGVNAATSSGGGVGSHPGNTSGDIFPSLSVGGFECIDHSPCELIS